MTSLITSSNASGLPLNFGLIPAVNSAVYLKKQQELHPGVHLTNGGSSTRTQLDIFDLGRDVEVRCESGGAWVSLGKLEEELRSRAQAGEVYPKIRIKSLRPDTKTLSSAFVTLTKQMHLVYIDSGLPGETHHFKDEHTQCFDQISRDPEVFEALKNKVKSAQLDELVPLLQELANSGLIFSYEQLILQEMRSVFKVGLGVLNKDLKQFKGGQQDDSDQLALARVAIQKMGAGDYLSTQSFVYGWNKLGVWEICEERFVRQQIHQALDGCDDISKSLVDGVTDLLKTELYVAQSPFDLQTNILVNVKNGTLRLNKGSWNLSPHCREDYLTTQIPTAYEPLAKCPQFEGFLESITKGDPDAAEKIACIWEGIGYTLLNTSNLETFFMLIGSGANGKSVLLGIIEALVSSKYVCAVQPSQFENRFQRAHMHGKLANIVTEIAEGAEVADAQLKSIVSGELTTAEHKHKAPFDFRPYVTCWFGTNHMPHTRDFSEALFRRSIVLTFNNKFYGNDRDTHLKEKLLSELPGILAKSLMAVSEAIARGGFTIPPSSIEATQKWRLEADQAAQFVEDKCVVEPTISISSAALYIYYKSWADDSGIKRTLSRNNFTTRLIRLGMATSKGTGGERVINGITTKAIWEGMDDLLK